MIAKNLTHAERLARGDRECWGIYRDDKGWWTPDHQWQERPSRRRDFQGIPLAILNCGGLARPRRFWRRNKKQPGTAPSQQAPAPAFEVGQWVRVKVNPVNNYRIVRIDNGEVELACDRLPFTLMDRVANIEPMPPGAVPLLVGDIVEPDHPGSTFHGQRGEVLRISQQGEIVRIVFADRVPEVRVACNCLSERVRLIHRASPKKDSESAQSAKCPQCGETIAPAVPPPGPLKPGDRVTVELQVICGSTKDGTMWVHPPGPSRTGETIAFIHADRLRKIP